MDALKKPIHGTINFPVIKICNGTITATEEPVVEETPLTLFLNGNELVTVLCSPGGETEMIAGFLTAEGIIAGPQDIETCTHDSDRNMAWVEARTLSAAAEKQYLKRCLSACCGKGRIGFYYAGDARIAQFNSTAMRLTPDEVLSYQAELEKASATFQATGGVHSGALAADGVIVCFRQDIGRHNVFDKLYGYCLLNGISTEDKILVFSGRISSEIVLKVAKMRISILIARSAPTSLALGMADELGITVIGFARNDRMNVYTHPQRLHLPQGL